jgi:hypothetical protein
MALAFHIDYTETVGTNPAESVRVDVETLEQAGEVITAIVKAAALDPNVEVGGFAITAM